MATVGAVEDRVPPDRAPAWLRWWFGGTPFDWGFAALTVVFVGAGYYDSFVNRTAPIRTWEDAPAQAAWFALSVLLVAAGAVAWRRDRSAPSLIRDGYGLSIAGCAVFLLGILLNGWWSNAFGGEFGVPALSARPTSWRSPGRC